MRAGVLREARGEAVRTRRGHARVGAFMQD
jgi:hypothetical protein